MTTMFDIENAMRVDASTWAQSNGVAFSWGNGKPSAAANDLALLWQFSEESQDRVTGATVVRSGIVRAEIRVPAGVGILAGMELAESLQSLFSGRFYLGARILDESTITPRGRDGASFVVDLTIPWEWDERRIPHGAVGLYETPGAAIAYQACRQLWESRVRAPLDLATYFDNDPPETAEPPFVIARFRTLQPIPAEIDTLRVPGRVLASVHWRLGAGLDEAEAAIDRIIRAFDEIAYRGVFFGTPIVNRIGRTSDHTWQANVRLPFYYEVKTR